LGDTSKFFVFTDRFVAIEESEGKTPYSISISLRNQIDVWKYIPNMIMGLATVFNRSWPHKTRTLVPSLSLLLSLHLFPGFISPKPENKSIWI